MTTDHPTARPGSTFEPRLEYSTPEELATLDRHYTAEAVDGPMSPADRAAREVDTVAARTADPSFPYDPTAEWGDPSFREPRSQEEADARTAHLDAERAEQPPHPIRELTEAEDALVTAQQDAVLADLAHDPDPELWAEVHRLEALADLAPLPNESVPGLDDAERDATSDDAPEAAVRDELVAVVDRDSLIFDPAAEGGFRSMTDAEHDAVLEQVRASGPELENDDDAPEPADPGLELEDAWFRASLDDVVPDDAPDRAALIESAVAVALDRFVRDAEITYPDQALDLVHQQQVEQQHDQPEPDAPPEETVPDRSPPAAGPLERVDPPVRDFGDVDRSAEYSEQAEVEVDDDEVEP